MTDIAGDALGESSGGAELIEPVAPAGGLERIHIATVVNPQAGNQIITAHRTAAGAQAQIDDLALAWSVARERLDATVLELPLLP